MAAYIFQKPWCWSDLVSSYTQGKMVVDNAVIPPSRIGLRQLRMPALLAFSNFLLTRSISVINQNDLAKQSLRATLIATIGLNVIITQVHERKYIRPKDNQILYAIWNYTPKTLAIVNAALIILGTKEKPIRTFAYTVTVIISALDAYKKLPRIASQAWSYMPWVGDALIFYDGHRMWAVLDFSTRLYFLYKRARGSM